MLKHGLRIRFIFPVSVFVILFVFGGALLFSSLENSRIERAVKVDTEELSHNVLQTLGVTDALMQAQTKSAMRLLIERGEHLGAATLGASTQVKDQTLPNLLLGGKPQANNFDLVDGVVKVVGGTSTLFVKSGEQFVRISTNVKRDNERAIGTVLDPKGKAIAAIREGKPFYGVVDILGNPFMTGYEPIRDAQGQTIGIWYVGYKIDVEALKNAIEKHQLFKSGFVAIVDVQEKVRFHSEHVSPEVVSQHLNESADWVVAREAFPAWGFQIITAYPRAEAEAVGRERMLSIILAGLLVSALLILIMWVMLRQMVLVPLGGEPTEASAVANRIAAGDLTVAIAVAPGDSTSMMAAVSKMRDGLITIVQDIKAGASALDQAARNLADMANRVSGGMAHQNDATASMAATLEEITVSIRHVTDSAGTASAMAGDAGELATESNTTVSAAVAEMQRSADSVNQSALMIEQLGESSQKISDIVNVIKEIADQTNLLALNAAIEAARAGEAGRGFAVVADEVRKLAERTTLSTREIADMIADIQQRTGQAISGIEEGASRVNGSVTKANQAVLMTGRMNGASCALVDAISEISTALREQSAASETIAQNVEQVATMNDENSTALQEVVEDAQRLQALAAQLNNATANFRI